MAGIYDDIMSGASFPTNSSQLNTPIPTTGGSQLTGKTGAAGVIGAAKGIGASFVDAFSPMPDTSVPDSGGFSNRVDLAGLRGREFEGEGFNIGNAIGGAAAGSALGPVGAVVGGAFGLGGSIIKSIRQKKAQAEFESNKRKAIRDAMFVNSSISTRERIMKNMAGGAVSQADRFYSNFGL